MYSRRPVRNNIKKSFGLDLARQIFDEIGGPTAHTIWEETGNLIVVDVFAWLWDGMMGEVGLKGGVGSIIDQESQMYLAHQGERNGQPNKGWLRTMYHGLTQQIIRADPGYYALYVACTVKVRIPQRRIALQTYLKSDDENGEGSLLDRLTAFEDDYDMGTKSHVLAKYELTASL